MGRLLLRIALPLALLLAACDRPGHDEPPLPPPPAVPADGGGVHAITMPHDEPALPPGRGRDAFIASCVICHSPRYVTNQPRFTREVWTEEVHKMMGLFNAPVPPDRVGDIVDYLVTFHGTEEAR